MRLGLGSYACAWEIASGGMDVARFLQRAEQLGLNLVQIADNLPLGAWTREVRGRFAIDIELGARGIAADHLRRYIEACTQVEARLLRVVIDSAGDEPSVEDATERIAGLVPDLRAAGVTLAIENHDRFTAQQFVQMVSTLNAPQVGICLDTANSFGALEGPDVVFDALLPWTVNLHLKDFSVQRFPNMMGFTITGTPAGAGRLDCAYLIRRLYAIRRHASVILELWPPAADNPAASIAREQEWARQSIDYLRPLIPR